MSCKVPKCGNEFRKNRNMSFFSFPKDKKVLQKWLSFCRIAKKNLKPTYSICADHFSPDVIEGNMQFQMGFGTKRRLAPGAVPTIRCPKKIVRDEGLDKKKNKEIVESLLEEYNEQLREKECATLAESTEFVKVDMESEVEIDTDSDTESDTESETETETGSESEPESECDYEVGTEILNDEIMEANDLELSNDEPIHLVSKEEFEEPAEIENPFETEMESLVKENKFLKQENSLLKERLLSMEKKYQYEMNALKEKLEKEMLEKNVLEEKVLEMEPMWTIISTS